MEAFTPSADPKGNLGPAAGGVTSATLTAPQDPNTPSNQTVERTDEKSDVVLLPTERVTETTKPNGDVVTETTRYTPTPVTRSKTFQKSTTNVGTTHVDTTGATSAKLASWRPVQFIGIVLILGALAMFHPFVFNAMGRNRLLQLVAGVAGLALICLPTLIVGNEKLLLVVGLGVVAALVVLHFLHEHSRLQGFVDANSDGIDDRKQ